jgi:hypothetical protein
MQCYKCGRGAGLILTTIAYCGRCYAEIIEKRVRKKIRGSGLGKMKVLMVKDRLCRHFIDKVFGKSGKRIVASGKADAVVVPCFLEDEIDDFMIKIAGNMGLRENRKIIKLFDTISYYEMRQYCKLRGIKFKAKKTSLDGIEARYPGTKHAMMKSIKELRACQS